MLGEPIRTLVSLSRHFVVLEPVVAGSTTAALLLAGLGGEIVLVVPEHPRSVVISEQAAPASNSTPETVVLSMPVFLLQ